MSSVRPGSPGAMRVCPHCRATVLESAAVCPGCRHHLRFSSVGGTPNVDEGYCALSLDGTIAHKAVEEACEYCIVVDVRNERGEPLVRQVVGVGLLQPSELRRFNVSVDMLPVRAAAVAARPAPVKAPVAPAPAAAAKPAAAMPSGTAAQAPAARGPSPGAPLTPPPPAARPAPAAPGTGSEAAASSPLLNPPQPGAKPQSGPLLPASATQRLRIFPKR